MDSNPNERETVRVYDYTFKRTPEHLSVEQLKPLQFKYDQLASRALEKLDEICPSSTARDSYAVLRDNAKKDPVLNELWTQVNTVPEWVDWEQIKKGQEFLYRYAPPAIAGFAFHGLIGSEGTSSRPAETLVRTGGHSTKVAKKRFFETFQLLLQTSQSLESIKPGGSGHAAVIRVRLLHASVRQRILKLAGVRPGYFNKEIGGIPINDLDSMQSVCAFSTNLIYLALPAQGIYPRKQESADYIALWRWVGYVIGAPDCVKTPAMARATMESVMVEAMRPSKNSRILTYNAFKALDGVPPIYASKAYFEAGSRWLNGDKLSDDIGLEKPSLHYTALIAGQCWVFMVVSYVTRAIPSLDEMKIKFFRELFWGYLIESDQGLGKESKFGFQYVPKIGETTTAEDATEKTVGKHTGVETIMLYALVFLCLSLVLGAGLFLSLALLVFKQIPMALRPGLFQTVS